MPKKAKELSPLAVGRLTQPGFWFVGGVAGLALQVTDSGARSWILRVMVGGKRRDIGLGGYPDVPLADARRKARETRDDIRKGVDPVEARKAARSALQAAHATAKTFKQCATAYIDAKSVEFRNAKHRAQWSSSVEAYAYPVLGNLLVRDIGLPHVLEVLNPIWTTKTETATRVRGRIEAVLAWATVQGYRTGDNPARWRNHLDKVLPAPKKVAKVEHHPALKANEMADFMKRLREMEGFGARALELVALTATRSGEVRGATWDEIDLDEAVWTIPAGRMKAGKEHRVPLSKQAVALLKKLPRIVGTPYVFPAAQGGMLSDMTLSACMRRMKVDAVPHGLRSTFRDWCGEQTNYPREVAEAALAHVIGGVEGAYARGDLFEKRRRLMADWAKFCDTPADGKGKVVPMRRSKTAA